MGEEKRYTIAFENLTKEAVLVLEESLINEQRRRVRSGERSWVVEQLLSVLWDEMRRQGAGYNPGDNAVPPETPPTEPSGEKPEPQPDLDEPPGDAEEPTD